MNKALHASLKIMNAPAETMNATQVLIHSVITNNGQNSIKTNSQ